MRTSNRETNGLRMEFTKFELPEWFEDCRDAAVLVHSPSEIPTQFEYQEYTMLFYGVDMEILITPVVIETDEELRHLAPNIRQCVFDNETKLKYFKRYTKENCIRECISEKVYASCNCVPFYYIRNETMTVCSAISRDCALRLKRKIINQELCNCLPLCNSIEYETENRIFKYSNSHQAL